MLITKHTNYKLMDIWKPKYSTQYGHLEEWCLLPLCSKVDGAPANIIVCEITKAKHILGNKYCMKRNKMMTYPKVWNKTSWCYEVPISHFEPFETPDQILEIIAGFGWL